MIEFLLLIPLAMTSAWEEIQQLVQRKSWRQEDYSNYLFWNTDPLTWKKNLDSHHIAFGAFIVIVCLCLFFINLTQWWMMPIVWVVFFWLRNIFMHIIFKKKPLWKYLIPIM